MEPQPQPQHPTQTLRLTSEPLVIFGSQAPESNAVKENSIRSSKIKRGAASRGNTHASILSSFSRLHVSRPRSVHTPRSKVASHRETSARPKVSYAFSPASFALSSLRTQPLEGPVDLGGHLECHIDKLPVELLGEIFIRCLPDIYFFVPRPTMAPILLCQICAYWRRVALTTPKLWVRLSVPGRTCHSSHLSLLELWMDRSLDHPLSLQFGQDIILWGDRDPAFEIILRHSHRWRYLSLALSDSLVDQFLEVHAGGVTSPLQVLKLDTSACTTKQASRIITALHRFPRLRRLQFTTHTSTYLLDAPWSQMTHIWLTCPTMGNVCLGILSRCSQVEDFRCSPVLASANCTSQKVLLHKLFFLHIQLGKDAGDVLDNIICPSLRVLRLKRWRSGPRAASSFLDFLSRSGCKLESFHLDDDDPSEDDIITHLRAPLLNTLQTLELECGGLGMRTLKALSQTDDVDARILLPSLHTIWFKFPALCRDDVVAMVESRMDIMQDGVIGVPLQDVFIGKQRHPVFRGGKIQTDTTKKILIGRRQA